LGDKISAADKAAVEADLADLKAVLDSGDAGMIKTKADALAQISMKLGEQMYKNQAANEAAAGGSASGAAGAEKPADPGVVDAEFSEVKDDKKSGTA